MHEIRIHGRGGQGTVLAAEILAKALAAEGKHAVAIPSFGFERRGAPVSACLRVDEREIRAMTNIYHPDTLLCIDPTVGRAVNIFDGMAAHGTLVQATKRPVDSLDMPETVETLGLCDAVGIALDIFKRPITNSVMLGAFARTTGLVSLEALKDGIEAADFRDAGLAQNLKAVERGYTETKVYGRKEGGYEARA
ncbi:MAG TPA: 2-oxoacid:acceptor oxidoreductase family protein [Azospirillum sp.]|nr:2-oxoacid:acceptor oxidoreductase family protein [Azospirillum sp.]